jgi:hypothetical protein
LSPDHPFPCDPLCSPSCSMCVTWKEEDYETRSWSDSGSASLVEKASLVSLSHPLSLSLSPLLIPSCLLLATCTVSIDVILLG